MVHFFNIMHLEHSFFNFSILGLIMHYEGIFCSCFIFFCEFALQLFPLEILQWKNALQHHVMQV